MLGGKLVWLTVVLIMVQGFSCSNSTKKLTETTLGTILPNERTPTEDTTSRKTEIPPVSQNPVLNEILVNSTNLNQTYLEVAKIFHGETAITNTTPTKQISANDTLITDSLNVTSVNEISWNDTFSMNFTMTEASASSDDVLSFRLPNWAAIAAGVCLVSAMIGYISCVSYRRFLQRKYGNSQILIGEDVYDTSDLRNFEI